MPADETTDPASPPVAPAAASPSARPSRRKLSRRKLWLFRLLAVVVAGVGLLALEGALRLAGVGEDLRLVVPVPGRPLLLRYQFNRLTDLAYYGATNVFGPEPRRFDLPKPPGVYRIVFLGASTVIGFPYSPEVAFPRQVETLLRLQEPDVRFEVLNAGITSMNSFAVADLARQCLACDPDLIVVHAGHNEFYGPGGPASSALTLPPDWLPTAYAIRRWRISQLLTRLIPSGGPVDVNLMDNLPRTFEIPLQSPIYQQAARNYRRNLEHIISVAQRSRTPVLLSTMACNLRDQSPMRPLWPADISAEQRTQAEQLFVQAETLLLDARFAEALALLQKLETICPGNARLPYRRAQCLEGLQELPQALAAYEQARDLDGCRFREPSEFSEIVRELAQRERSSLVRFLDIAQRVNAAAAPLAPGNDLFLEHVHYTFSGHRLLGKLFARGIQEQLRSRPWREDLEPDTDALRERMAVIPEDDIAAQTLALFVIQSTVERGALDAQRQHRHMTQLLEQGYRELSPQRRDVFSELSIKEMEADLIPGLVQRHLAAGNAELGIEFARKGIVRQPDSAALLLLLGEALIRTGQGELARTPLAEAQAMQPRLAPFVQTLLKEIVAPAAGPTK